MPLINIFVSSPDTYSERRFESSLVVSELQEKLYSITGISPQFQRLSVSHSSSAGQPQSLDDQNRSLDSYGVKDGYHLKVDNLDPNARPGEFSDVSGVNKFELSNEEYESRPDTVLAHLKANKMGRFAPVPENLSHPPPPSHALPENVSVGSRCQVAGEGGNMDRIGTVRFVGIAEIGKGGVWIGVELDEPVGKGDGEVEGKRYFSCSPKHAIFVRPEKITTGDFPEEDLMADDVDEI
ncbi:CAP Gly-rich domain-containing protein [Kockovaella imperatae]|uniref:CAP Gly-rich domain-containing protein n=1 Tax=Kockovaella imperatae TaxID=4999 RepID=A0A1Y1UP34_9TREE|nr:CAP Gly-rich domain-containing protein [Kockovaella imperatae]ORX39808.1 CAP Gly-rich domain-containing protein [Kockovaella imperatae]